MYRILDKFIYIFFWLTKVPILYYFCKRAGKILKEWNDVSIQQLKLLMDIVSLSDHSEFGKKYKFSDIKSVDQYRKNISIGSYERVYPYVKEVVRGNSRVLFNNPKVIKDFIATSGTGGCPKILPLNKEYVRRVRNFWTLWGTFLFKDHREILGYRLFHMVNNIDYFKQSDCISDFDQKLKQNNTCKDTTGVVSTKIPGFIREGFRVPSFVSHINHHKLRLYCSLRFACADENLRLMMGVSPWNYIVCYDILIEHIEDLLNDLKNGGVCVDKFEGVTENDKKLLERYGSKFIKDNYTYERLSTLYQTKGNNIRPSDIWPHLSVIGCWSQSQFKPVCQRIKELYNCPSIRDTGLIATEGSYSIPMQDNTDEGLLNLDWGFYEFIPEEEYDKYVDGSATEYSSELKPLLAHEIQSGKRYYLIITTYSGLFRHDQKDLIECTGHYKNIPLIRFISKVGRISDITGEKLTDDQVAEVCEHLLKKNNLAPFYISVHPVTNEYESYYELLVPSGKLDNINLDLFCKDFDDKMSEINCIFKEHIQDNKLKHTRIVFKSADFWKKIKSERAIDRYKHPYIIKQVI